jgi:hypothetical protein
MAKQSMFGMQVLKAERATALTASDDVNPIYLENLSIPKNPNILNTSSILDMTPESTERKESIRIFRNHVLDAPVGVERTRIRLPEWFLQTTVIIKEINNHDNGGSYNYGCDECRGGPTTKPP